MCPSEALDIDCYSNVAVGGLDGLQIVSVAYPRLTLFLKGYSAKMKYDFKFLTHSLAHSTKMKFYYLANRL